MTTAELTQAVRALLEAATTTPPEDLTRRANALRAQVEKALLETAEPEPLGFLSDTVAAISLYAREMLRGNTERAGECLEMSQLFLKAALDVSRE